MTIDEIVRQRFKSAVRQMDFDAMVSVGKAKLIIREHISEANRRALDMGFYPWLGWFGRRERNDARREDLRDVMAALNIAERNLQFNHPRSYAPRMIQLDRIDGRGVGPWVSTASICRIEQDAARLYISVAREGPAEGCIENTPENREVLGLDKRSEPPHCGTGREA